MDVLGPWFAFSALLGSALLWFLTRPPDQWPGDPVLIDAKNQVWRIPPWYTRRNGWLMGLFAILLLYLTLSLVA